MPLAMSLADSKTLLLGAAVVGVPSALWILSRSRRPSGNSDCSDFSSFLKQPGQPQPSLPPQSCCTSFESFLKTGNQQQEQQGASGPSAVDGSAGVAAGPAAVPLDRAPVTVLFGTEYGFSKEIAEKLAERIKATGQFWPRLLDMADHPQGLPLSRHQALLVVCSTQGDGVPPAEARDFCEWLHSGAPAAGGPLAGLAYSVCALGDKSYQHYCRCGRQLDARLRELGAAQLHGRADINREDWKAVEAWMEGVLGALPTLGLRTAEELGELEGDEGTGPGHATKRWSKARPYFGTVTALEGLCNITGKDDKNTFRVEIDLGDSGLEYIPGDALGIWPHNCPEAVDELLAMLGAEPGLLVQVPSWHYQDPEVGEGRTTMALRDALTKCYDLRCPKPELLRLLLDLLCAKQDGLPKPPRPTTNGHAATRAGGATAGKAAPGGKRSSSDGAGAKENAGGGGGKAAQQTQQPKTAVNGAVTNGTTAANGVAANGVHHQALCADGCIVDKLERLAALVADASAAAAYLEPRHVIDVLADFAPARPSVGALLSMLRPLQPRLYSISSSQREAQHSVQATVAVVRYASLGKDRKGVASTFLGERLELGQQVPIYIHKNPDFRLPRDHSTPIVMVGPGTGLAPFRSFMQERLLACQESGQALGPCVLYFGCRRRDQDYLYGPLLEAWAAEGTLRLFTAFSREQAGPKMYVQNRLRESGPLVWELLQAGGHFYVCGDAANMAGQVEEVLLEVIAQQGGREPQQAQQYLDDLAAAGRYQRDVWF